MSSSKLLQAYKQDVRKLRITGVAVYQLLFGLIVLLVQSAVPLYRGTHRSSSAILLCSGSLLLLQLLPSIALSFLLVTRLPRPLPLSKYLPRSLPRQLQLVSWPAAQILGRARDLNALARTGFITATISSTAIAFVSFYLYVRVGQFEKGAVLYGGILGLCFSLHIFSGGGDILTFPALQRRRLFRLKQKLLPVALTAVKLPLAALVISAVLPIFGIGALRSLWEARPVGLLLAGAVCSVCLSMGAMIVQVIFTERLSFTPLGPAPADLDVNTLLFAALQDPQEEALYAAALCELNCIAESHGKLGAERRLDIFADDTGAKWQLPAQACILEVNSLTATIADGLPQMSQKNTASTGQHAPKWNQRPTSTKPALVVSDWHQDEAAWMIRSRYQTTGWAVRALAGFCAASLTEDRHGVVQLTEPGLGAAAQSILSLLLALQQHLKATASTGRRRESCCQPSEVGHFARALEDIAAVSVRLLADTFGADLHPALLGVRSKPTFGGPSELAALLKACSSLN